MMRRFLLMILTFAGCAGAAHAQFAPYYGNGAYPPPAAMMGPYGYSGPPSPYGYPPNPQPIQPVQYSYGNNGYPPNAYPPPNAGYYAELLRLQQRLRGQLLLHAKSERSHADARPL